MFAKGKECVCPCVVIVKKYFVQKVMTEKPMERARKLGSDAKRKTDKRAR
jgi:hypothetical protein